MDDFDRADKMLEEGRGKEALALFSKVAATGRVDAMHSIAHTCLYGIAGVGQDYDLAFEWFTRAAKGGCPQAMYHLGLCNAMGYGTEKNPGLSCEWYRKSADRGDEDAMYRLGDCYEKGFGCGKNIGEAVKWYRKAAEYGQQDAAERLKELA